MREDMQKKGLAVWLYRIERDPMRLNMPPERIAPDLLRRPPMPLRLHYMKYFNEARTHLSLNKDAPIPRAVQAAERILCRPILGGFTNGCSGCITRKRRTLHRGPIV
jgi:hypothetical protein